MYNWIFLVDTISNQLKSSLMVLLFSLPGNHQRLLVATGVDN